MVLHYSTTGYPMCGTTTSAWNIRTTSEKHMVSCKRCQKELREAEERAAKRAAAAK